MFYSSTRKLFEASQQLKTIMFSRINFSWLVKLNWENWKAKLVFNCEIPGRTDYID